MNSAIRTKTRIVRWIFISGFIFSLLIALTNVKTGKEYPHSTFLFRPFERFQDFYAVMRTTQYRTPYVPIMFIPDLMEDPEDMPQPRMDKGNYFPVVYLLMYPLTLIPQKAALQIFLVGLLAMFSILLWKFYLSLAVPREEMYMDMVILTTMNYPLLYILDRGNIEGLVFVFVAMAVWLYYNRKTRLGAIVLSMAAAMKGFPLIFFIMWLRKKLYRDVLWGTLFLVGISFTSVLFFKGGVLDNINLMTGAMTEFNNIALSTVNGITHGDSLFGALYAAKIMFSFKYTDPQVIKPYLTIYQAVAAVLTILMCIYVVKARCQEWKLWFLIVAAIQILPFPSFDYKLIYTFIPLALLLKEEASERWTGLCLVLISCVMIPKGFPVLFSDVRVSSLINPILILTICSIILVQEVADAKDTAH